MNEGQALAEQGAAGPRRVAALDVGSNTVLALVAECTADGLSEVAELARTTRLADHTPAARERTFAAIIDLVGEARQLGATVVGAVGTAALRDDPGATAFVSAVHASAGVDIEIVDPTREAELSLSGAITDVGELRGVWLLCDVGGASTELARVDSSAVTTCASVDIGAVVVSERIDRTALEQRVRHAIDGIGLPPSVAGVLAVGGSATTLAAMTLELQPYDPARISRYTLTRAAVERWILQLAPLAPAQRRVAGLALDRAPVIVSGALILAAILDAVGASAATVTDHCLRWGLARELAKQ